MDFRQLQMKVDKNQIDNIYFLYGDEPFLIDKSIELIKACVLTEGLLDFNSDSFYAGEKSVSAIKDIIETLPVMSPKRLVILKQAHLLKEQDWNTLLPILENPVDTTTLVFSAEKMDKRKKVSKIIEKNGTLVELKRPYDNKLLPWITYLATELNLQIEADALRLIHHLVGSNLYEIHNELKKLKSFNKQDVKITSEVVLSVVSKSRVLSVFDLTNAIGRNDKISALTCLANLLDHGHSEIGSVQLIARHIRILAQVKEGVTLGMNQSQIASKVGVPQFFLKDYLMQSRQWSQKKIERTIQALYDTDKALKSSPVSASIWLENFVLSTCQEESPMAKSLL